jgi:hypothetical protein
MADQWLALIGLRQRRSGHCFDGICGWRWNGRCSVGSTRTSTRFMPDSNSRVFLFCVNWRVEWGNSKQQKNHQQTASYSNTALMVTSYRMVLVCGDPRWLTSHQVQFWTWGGRGRGSLLSLQQLVNLVSLVKWRPISCLFHLHYIWLFSLFRKASK